ncbi:hypothetical protein [Bernardetia sp. MNP-M8]|uniref:hypothetical protein n=1 Tax=Bernardetia sp. MNP-M8 TaxID=3127470 RepID=UPI0030D128D2
MTNFLINFSLFLATFFSFYKSKKHKKEAKELKEELEKETRKKDYLQQQNDNYVRRLYPNKTPVKIDCIVCESPFETIDVKVCESCRTKIQYSQHSEPTKN